MRVLVISHACVAEDNRAKWEYLAKSKEAEIEIHLPHYWPSWESAYHPIPSRNPNLTIRVNHVFRAGHEDQYFFAPKLSHRMQNGDFDILHVEQGSSAMVYFQALLERNWRSHQTKTCFFTWINWESSLRWPWTIIEPYNLHHSNGAIGGNQEAVDILKRRGFCGKTAVIPQLGVDLHEYSPGNNLAMRKKLGLQGLVIGFVGRLVEEKGICLLLKSIKKVSKKLNSTISLLFLGGGPLETKLAYFRQTEPICLVHVPPVSHQAVRDYLHAMDILVLPSYSTSRWKEQFGHVLIEAMACEIPVIGSDSAAIPEVIGDAGLIFPERDSEKLSQQLQTFIQSAEARKRFGYLGRQRVLKHFTHEEIARQTLAFWKSL